MSQAPPQTQVAKRVAESAPTALDLARPMVWPSSVFPGRQIAVSVRDIQLLCPSRHGPPPDPQARMFLLYSAGWGVDPRIGQSYLIPFETELESGKKMVTWQMGLHHQVFMFFASAHGTITGHTIIPDPTEWPLEFPGDKFAAKIVVHRRPPLRPIEYGGPIGSMMPKKGGKPARAWADGKVGWAHMFQVALKRRGYRDAMAMGGAYGAEEFGEVEPAYEGVAEQVEFVPPVAPPEDVQPQLEEPPPSEAPPKPSAPPEPEPEPTAPPVTYEPPTEPELPADEQPPPYGDPPPPTEPPTEPPKKAKAPKTPKVEPAPLPQVGSPCPKCGVGQVRLTRSQFGPFLGCTEYRTTGCDWRHQIPRSTSSEAPDQPPA